MSIKVENSLDISKYGGLIFPADLNNDGTSEFLVLQSPGLFHAEIHKALLNDENHPGRNHFCLTAIDTHGNILWQIGTPWQHDFPWPTHGGERSLCVCDLDSDGKREVYVIKGKDILGIDALSGKVVRKFPLPYDNFVNLLPGRVATGRGGMRLLASPSNDSYDNHEHGGPSIIFDADGEKVFERDIFGFGHDPVVLDLEGDGVDKWLAGYELLDHNFKKIWEFEPCPKEMYDGLEMHVDGLSLCQPGNKKDFRIAYAASTFLYVIDIDGKLVWEKELVHPQQVHWGFFDSNKKVPQLFVLNKRADLQLFDFHGNELYRVTPEENWPNGKPSGMTNKFHLFDPTVKIKGEKGCNDTIIYCEGGWPYGIDEKGRRTIEFECSSSAVQPDCSSDYRRPDDYGWGYTTKEVIDNRGHHLIISDRNSIFTYNIAGKENLKDVDGFIIYESENAVKTENGEIKIRVPELPGLLKSLKE
ncbi:MAG: hypothetical protein ACYTFY_09680 [Planctomycetota bacterium]|jgi:hypothetical protein